MPSSALAATPESPSLARTARVLGSECAWWEIGPSAGDARATVVLVHGFRGTHHGLLPVVERLPDVRFLAPDLPGFGESQPLASGHTLDDYSAWLEAFLHEVDPNGTAIVLGHSFGSLVIARRPVAIGDRRLVLVNPIAAPALEGQQAILTKLAIFYYWLGSKLPESAGRVLLSHPLITRVMSEVMAKTTSKPLRAWIHAEHERHFSDFSDRDTLLAAFRASVSDSVLAHAHELPASTALIAGALDDIAPLEAQLELARLAELPLHVIAGTGHLVHYETPIAAARLLSEFIDENSTPDDSEHSR
ncbi:alpha/beta hydrolase [Pseudoclavibacter sp. RFBJ3]|uniref:alpha/beta fold hydrolase n=1 Tax=unclassified Pseudoclavibacter TaxID=2615177 RepID=UPI000CE81E7D|nr:MULTISPECIES: alpha/beta hydrolase [unclassified Pseudoclavibacter]PPF84381.1 alpha/beta hydrolase [Pseudoclavibacter sp. RFBJ5]PPF92719.1 alpha/beta hydrolase [Pseudoclavibacter sp. RFBJ3]PPF98209.1 alpha/beta hydrolase [Pseudoclavibacter sp. RFBH5]PPG25279.1 alpha/beta hydrolase [Pseudoclavibacter sp. RFBI4]